MPDADQLYERVGYGVGLTAGGEVWWWATDPTLAGPASWVDNTISYRLAALERHRVALLSFENTLYVTEQHPDDLEPRFSHVFPTNMEIVEIATANAGACVLDTDGIVTCVGAESPSTGSIDPVVFDSPPYLGLRGGFLHVCAQRADHVIECNDGSEHDFGPTRDFDVHSEKPYDEAGVPIGGPTALPTLTLCAITADNGIRCAGDRYFDDVLALLPVGDGQQPSAPP